MVKVEKNNEEGKKIVKEISENLLSTYLTIGWKIVDEKSANEQKPFENGKENK